MSGYDETERLGWTTAHDATEFLSELYGFEAFEASGDDRRGLLLSAFNEIKANPNYQIALYDSSGWNSYSDEQKLNVQQAQAFQAFFILQNGNSADASENLKLEGVKSYSIGRFSKTFGGKAERDSGLMYDATTLSRRVENLLFGFRKQPKLIGRIYRRYQNGL